MSRTVMSPSFISQMPSVSPSIISAPMSAAALRLEVGFLCGAVTIHLGEDNRIEEAVGPQLMSKRTLFAETVLLIADRHYHHFRMGLETGEIFLRRCSELKHEELDVSLNAADERCGVVGEDRVGVWLALVGIEVYDVFLSLTAVGGQRSSAIDVVGSGVRAELHVSGVLVLAVGSNNDGDIAASDATCGTCLATFRTEPVELSRLCSGHQEMSFCAS